MWSLAGQVEGNLFNDPAGQKDRNAQSLIGAIFLPQRRFAAWAEVCLSIKSAVDGGIN